MNESLRILSSIYSWPKTKPDVESDLHGWLIEQNKRMLGAFLDEETKIVVELGSWLGMSAKFILEQAPHAILICVDHWQGSKEHIESQDVDTKNRMRNLYDTFLVNLWDDRHRVIPVRSHSVLGLMVVANLNITPNLIYIDASHEYHDVVQDVKAAVDLFPQSVICGDDWNWPGVKCAVNEIANLYEKRIVNDGANVWRFESPEQNEETL